MFKSLLLLSIVSAFNFVSTPSFAADNNNDDPNAGECQKKVGPLRVSLADHGILDSMSGRVDSASVTTSLESLNSLAVTVNAFSAHFFGELLKTSQNENIVFSGYNLMQLLLVLANNAEPKTQIAFVSALDRLQGRTRSRALTEDVAKETILEVTRAFRYSMAQLKSDLGEGNEVDIATGLFATDKNFEFKPEDIAVAQKAFDAVVQSNADLAGINQWVSDKTRGLIPSLFEEQPNPAAIVTTLYLKGIWESIFVEAVTKDKAFHAKDGSVLSTLPMMNQTNPSLRHISTQEFSAVSIPFKSGRLVVDLIVPNYDQVENGGVRTDFSSSTNLENTLRKVTTELSQVLAQLDAAKPKEIELEMPKFKIAEGVDNAVPILAQMGIPGFQFSGLNITNITHKAVYKQDEKGAEFAAASGAFLESMRIVEVVEANRPFIFVLRDTKTGLILGGPSLVVKPEAN